MKKTQQTKARKWNLWNAKVWNFLCKVSFWSISIGTFQNLRHSIAAKLRCPIFIGSLSNKPRLLKQKQKPVKQLIGHFMGQSPCYIVTVSRGLSIKTQRHLVLTYSRHLVVGDRRTRKCWSEENYCSHKNFNLYHRFKNFKVSWITVEPLTGKKNMISLVNRDSQIIFSTNHDKTG